MRLEEVWCAIVCREYLSFTFQGNSTQFLKFLCTFCKKFLTEQVWNFFTSGTLRTWEYAHKSSNSWYGSRMVKFCQLVASNTWFGHISRQRKRTSQFMNYENDWANSALHTAIFFYTSEFSTAKFHYCEVSLRRSVFTANFPYNEISYGEISVHGCPDKHKCSSFLPN